MSTTHTEHSCIWIHKPKADAYQIGAIWICPTCTKQWERVDFIRETKRVAWSSVMHDIEQRIEERHAVIGTIELYNTGRYEAFGHRAIYESHNKAWTLLVPSNLQTNDIGKTIEIQVRRCGQ